MKYLAPHMGKTKRLPRPFIKIKRLSRRKKIILSCEVKKCVRWKRERDKMPAISEATINFNTLKIVADPQMDIDYIRSISLMSIYDRNYRGPVQESTSEDPVHIRSVVMHNLSNLSIDENEGTYNANTPQQDIGSEILQKTSFLRISDINEPNIYDRIRNIVV
ncbi:PREDICTED: uncharacterized protein LOC105560831 [Vollenhovia emeryi]|uniref:uncharacterized protein LOC105560831 n=1 Tax=Vollenhovia emeryi TaxID=411798 RepID=UPI0005F403FB|nr:PREDICTED: uncharacterized protein LOC105560831 [Vollenhovia emeryi]